MISAEQALTTLIEGNRRFVAGTTEQDASARPARREGLAGGQSPFAIVLGCADSRVPAEIVFDQGLGDLFVIRVAGNIATPSQIGSIEFAAEQFATPLVVVLGHTRCGAVQATLEHLKQPTNIPSPNLASIVNGVRPAIEPLLESGGSGDPAKLAREAGRANIRASADQIRNGSEILSRLRNESGLVVVGAEYSLETGEVEFFDGLPGAA